MSTGDPIGPYLFALAIMDLTKQCKSEWNLWYLDDGVLGGEVETVLNDYKLIMGEEKSLGLKLRPANVK